MTERRPRFALIATMRNEAPRLLEWVAHHRGVGFDPIFVASNDCTDGTDGMLARLQDMEVLTHIDNQRRYVPFNIRQSAYAKARMWPQIATAEWLLTLDADEFFNSRIGDGSPLALISSLPEGIEAVQIPCRLFGSAGLKGLPPAPVLQAFGRAATMATGAKLLTRNHARFPILGRWGPEMPDITPAAERFAVAACRADGTPIDSQAMTAADRPLERLSEHLLGPVKINHYAAMTPALFLIKRARGHAGTDVSGVCLPASRADFSARDQNAIEDRSIAQTSEQRQSWMVRFLADAALRRMHDDASARLAEHVAEAETGPTFADARRRLTRWGATTEGLKKSLRLGRKPK